MYKRQGIFRQVFIIRIIVGGTVAVLIGGNDLAFKHNGFVFFADIYVHRVAYSGVGRVTPLDHIKVVKSSDNIVIFWVARNDPPSSRRDETFRPSAFARSSFSRSPLYLK